MRAITNPASDALRDRLAALRERVAARWGADAGERLERLMLDTWQTTMRRVEDRVFVLTGDIPAMWLRDSSAQVWPFLRLLDVAEVREVLLGIVREQWRCIALDPYANAFNASDSDAHHDPCDLDLLPGVWERKYEIDSLSFPILLADALWGELGDEVLRVPAMHDGCRAVVELWRREQDHERRSPYRHVRDADPVDTLPRDGRGAPVAVTGMTWSGFRPSDDACRYGYNIPAQCMAVRALRHVAAFAGVWGDESLAADARALGAEIHEGIERHGLVDGRYAYEVDGLGGVLEMDDANMPSLLSLPLTSDVAPDDTRYLATRAWALSDANPCWWSGRAAEGIGSPHTPSGHVWHIALAVQGLTGSRDEAERCLRVILATDGGTGWTHESFHVDDPTVYTRAWFSWSNSMLCELMLQLLGGA